MSYPTLYEVSPAVPATDDKPSRGPSYKATKYKSSPEAPLSTLYDTFEASVKAHGDRPCLGYRPIDDKGKPGDYTFMTYLEVQSKVKAFASALKTAGVQKQQRVAVFGQNCCEWMIAMQVRDLFKSMCMRLFLVFVSVLYPDVPRQDELLIWPGSLDQMTLHSGAVRATHRTAGVQISVPQIDESSLMALNFHAECSLCHLHGCAGIWEQYVLH